MSSRDGTFLSEENLQAVLESLVERDRGRREGLEFPEKSYALGGAGKSLMYELLETEWFLIELILDQDRSTTEFHIIDTETESKGSGRVADIEERIDTIERLLDEEHGITDTPRIRIRKSHLTAELQVNRISDFIGPSVVDDVLTHSKDPQADTWWIDRETLLDNGGDMHNLAKGAIRRRSLSKGFYYKAQSETNFEPKHLDLKTDDGQVAIFAGLGGGTGSGMFIDLARAIRRKRDNVRITFFGVIPDKNEGEKERANAYAALSELEYLALNRDDRSEVSDQFPFADVVLTPIDPTEHQSSVDHNLKLENFDIAYTYVPISYYNNQGLDEAFQPDAPYAPFTVAIPQLLRYNVQQIREARKQADAILQQKESAIAAERRLHDEIRQLLRDHYDVTGDSRLSTEDASTVEGRIHDLLDFVDKGTFADSSVSRYIDHVFGDDPRSKTLDELIEDIQFALGDGGQYVDDTPTANPYVEEESQERPDELDETARERINEELQQIRSMHEILSMKREVGRQEIRTLIDFLLNPEAGKNAARDVDNRMSSILEDLGDPEKGDGEIGRKREELQKLETELENRRQEQREVIDRIVNDWSDDECRGAVERLHELESIQVDSQLQKLRNALQGFGQELRSADGSEIQRAGEDISEIFEEISSELPSAEREKFDKDRSEIVDAMGEVREARRAYVAVNNQTIRDKLAKITGGDDPRDEYENIALRVNDQQVFQVPLDPDGDFRIDLQYQPSITQEVAEEKKQVRKYLEQTFIDTVNSETDMSSVPSEHLENYLDLLEFDDPSRATPRGTLSDLEDIVRNVVEDAVADIGEIHGEIEETKEEIETLEARRSRFEDAYALFSDVAQDVQDYKSGQRSFKKHLEDPFTDPAGTDDEDEVYASIRTPENLADTTDSGSLSDSDLLSQGGVEASEVRDHFLDCVEDRFLNQAYNGLENRTFVTPDGTRSFDGTRLCVALAGDVFTEDESQNRENLFDGAIGNLKGNLGVRKEDDDFWRWSVRNGGLWDVSMCVFLQGITFFENLEPVISRNRGYASAYNNRTDGKSLSQRIQRHAYGLERGFFIERNEHYPITQGENQRLFITEQSDKLAEMLFDTYDVIEFSDRHLAEDDENVEGNSESRGS